MAVFIAQTVIMLRCAMTIPFETLRTMLPMAEQFDRLLAIGWEDVGGVVLAVGGIVFLTAVGALRSR
ncbi:hypothetical protein [Sphingomonas lacusdianchii]|uniref:hypothetical protein n=1 Tax=Sphingomonas lacusdianchii TaxID=2917992 RepID=UPI001F5878B5|nr:hypothetical protein [Sphingomonas sp. JXJ CY 53]